jgi:hypothetical protein
MKDIICDFLGILCIGATGYAMLVIGHGVGF